MSADVFEPASTFFDFHERGFVVYDRDDEIDVARIDMLLAMSPTERLRWHEYWKERTKKALLPLHKETVSSLIGPHEFR